MFVRDLYANLALMEICEFGAFLESVSYVFSMLSTGSTPAASTTNIFIFNGLQEKSIEIAKSIATRKLFRVS